jgi:predicted MPP superfamily phosphohydrolase
MIGLTVFATSVGVIQALSWPKVFRVDVPIKDLPPAFNGYKIVQISDLHVGALIRKNYVERVTEMTNVLNADIIALTGDMADGRAAILKDDIPPLAGMKAKDGVFMITGNHEYYWFWEEWDKLYKEMNIHLLLNGHRTIKRGGDKIIVGGILDKSQGSELSNPALAFEKAPKEGTRILLAHQPNNYQRAKDIGVDLQLSGHTHGGQFFPWNLVVRFFHRYFTGLNEHEGMQIYINQGTGFWGTPLRGFVPPEITLLTLHTAP